MKTIGELGALVGTDSKAWHLEKEGDGWAVYAWYIFGLIEEPAQWLQHPACGRRPDQWVPIGDLADWFATRKEAEAECARRNAAPVPELPKHWSETPRRIGGVSCYGKGSDVGYILNVTETGGVKWGASSALMQESQEQRDWVADRLREVPIVQAALRARQATAKEAPLPDGWEEKEGRFLYTPDQASMGPVLQVDRRGYHVLRECQLDPGSWYEPFVKALTVDAPALMERLRKETT